MFYAVSWCIREEQNECIKKRWYISPLKYIHLKKEENPATWNNVNETERHYAKWNKPDREKQIMHGITYMAIKKEVNLIETASRRVVAKGNREKLVKEHKLSVTDGPWLRMLDLQTCNVMLVWKNSAETLLQISNFDLFLDQQYVTLGNGNEPQLPVSHAVMR